MKTWWEFVQNHTMDEKQLDAIYDKTHIATELVRMYKPELLQNIASIANLASGAYGIYNSGENRKILPQPLEQRLIYYGKINRHNIDMIPKAILKRYFPDVPENEIKESDTIHVNVKRIMNEFRTDLERVLEIASTIVHEATHEIERETQGWTNETGPEAAERDFMNWAQNNMQQILRRYPELGYPKFANGFNGHSVNFGFPAGKPRNQFSQSRMPTLYPQSGTN